MRFQLDAMDMETKFRHNRKLFPIKISIILFKCRLISGLVFHLFRQLQLTLLPGK